MSKKQKRIEARNTVSKNTDFPWGMVLIVLAIGSVLIYYSEEISSFIINF